MKYSRAFIKKSQQISTATIGHLTNFGFMDGGIRPLYPEARMTGPARTVQIPALDGTGLREMLERVRPGDVIIIDQGRNTAYACWGEIMALRAQSIGAAGVVIDGSATDSAEIKAMGFPTFSRGVTAITTKRYGLEGLVDLDVCVGGVVVHPGDLIIADVNGVVVLQPREARGLVEAAIAKEKDEVHMRKEILEGKLRPIETVLPAKSIMSPRKILRKGPENP